MPDEDRNGSDQRPSPEALLAEVGQEGRGRLKIFLGAAPGVGKTYEMLTSARRRKLDGVDVVVGLVETHGRRETAALLAGLEIVPRRRESYRGRDLEEMDLDRLLKRRPQLALVDELAHENAPGSRHPKRWMDVQELLAAGIDVWTTMNVQHVESLNDVVAQITHVRVRETVPDSVLDQAEIELIDLTPDELRERLHEGKVYVPEAACARARPLFQPRQPHRPARAGAAADGRARRQPDGPVHARPRPRRPLGRAGAAAGLRAWRRGCGRAGPLHQAAGRPPACALDGDPRADRRRPARRRGRQRPGGRHAASGRAAGRRDAGPARRADRRGDPGLGARQQRHPDRHRQRAPLGLARLVRRLAAA